MTGDAVEQTITAEWRENRDPGWYRDIGYQLQNIIQRHRYALEDSGSKPDDPGWHSCSCGEWEGYWSDFQPHVADHLRASVLAVAVRGISEADLDQALAERDDAQEWADRLAYAIAPQEVIGEHSSANNPWQNALDLAVPLPDPTHGNNHAPLPEGVWLDPGYCAGCDAARAARIRSGEDTPAPDSGGEGASNLHVAGRGKQHEADEVAPSLSVPPVAPQSKAEDQ